MTDNTPPHIKRLQEEIEIRNQCPECKVQLTKFNRDNCRCLNKKCNNGWKVYHYDEIIFELQAKLSQAEEDKRYYEKKLEDFVEKLLNTFEGMDENWIQKSTIKKLARGILC